MSACLLRKVLVPDIVTHEELPDALRDFFDDETEPIELNHQAEIEGLQLISGTVFVLMEETFEVLAVANQLAFVVQFVPVDHTEAGEDFLFAKRLRFYKKSDAIQAIELHLLSGARSCRMVPLGPLFVQVDSVCH